MEPSGIKDFTRGGTFGDSQRWFSQEPFLISKEGENREETQGTNGRLHQRDKTKYMYAVLEIYMMHDALIPMMHKTKALRFAKTHYFEN